MQNALISLLVVIVVFIIIVTTIYRFLFKKQGSYAHFFGVLDAGYNSERKMVKICKPVARIPKDLKGLKLFCARINHRIGTPEETHLIVDRLKESEQKKSADEKSLKHPMVICVNEKGAPFVLDTDKKVAVETPYVVDDLYICIVSL